MVLPCLTPRCRGRYAIKPRSKRRVRTLRYFRLKSNITLDSENPAETKDL